jgi:hypothetical protein
VASWSLQLPPHTDPCLFLEQEVAITNVSFVAQDPDDSKVISFFENDQVGDCLRSAHPVLQKANLLPLGAPLDRLPHIPRGQGGLPHPRGHQRCLQGDPSSSPFLLLARVLVK